MRIRDAAPADIDAIIEIGHRTWPATYGFAGDEYVRNGLDTWWSTEATERTLRDTTVLVAEAESGLIGIGNIDLRGDVPIIWKLYVLPGAQGTGAGTALIEALLAKAPGLPVRLEYVDGNANAARFYQRRGFTELSREPGERPGWPETVWMEHRPA
ncbi:GNAT family N-acetyltransferase [Paractinoplanes globisporus]|uniref:GNAT family N-acetyltransferase n=1 Tax=Paractinoplanes globisporus TaxID=113565 RepID=A0ABW6WSP3_9ACTN|nr:GNAT family N-acetyltransferase [Actinoplanes globisporus]